MITDAFWRSKSLRNILKEGGHAPALVAAYLVTNEFSKKLGCYLLDRVMMESRLGLSRHQSLMAFTVLHEDGFAFWDEPWVWIPNMLKWARGTGRIVLTDPVVEEAIADYNRLPADCPYKGDVWQHFQNVLPLGDKPNADPDDPAGSFALTPLSAKEGLLGPSFDQQMFDRWWSAYPKKHGKRAAWQEWFKLRPDKPTVDRWLIVLEQQKRSREWLKEGGQFIPDPERYLKRGRYDDTVIERPFVDDKQTATALALGNWVNKRRNDDNRDVLPGDRQVVRRLRQAPERSED